MKLFHVTVHTSSGPYVVTVLAGTVEQAIEAAKRQLRARPSDWAHAKPI